MTGTRCPAPPKSSTITAMRLRSGLAVLPLVLVPLVACAPQDDIGSGADDSGSAAHDGSSPPRATGSPGEPMSAPPADACATDQLNLKTPGQLTIGTDSPAYDPWFQDNDPTNGKGYESAVAYAVAEQLGFSADQVTWVKVPFNTSYKPGDKS